MKEVYKKLFEMSIDSVVVTDQDGCIILINDAFTENTGYTLQEVIGKKPSILRGDGASTDYKEMWDTLLAGKEWSGEFYNKDKYGDHFWEFARIAPVRDSAGNLYFVAVKQNITKIKSLEDKLGLMCDKMDVVKNEAELLNEQIKQDPLMH